MELERRNIIARVTQPTDWVSNMVVVRKKNNDIRICLDPTNLNKAVKRPHYALRTIDDVLPDLARAKVFSVVDASNGFW